MTKRSKASEFARTLRISQSRALEAVIKAQLIAAIIEAAKKKGLTHEILAERSGLPRSAVTGILSGSVQKLTINRLLRLVGAADLVAEIKVRNAA